MYCKDVVRCTYGAKVQRYGEDERSGGSRRVQGCRASLNTKKVVGGASKKRLAELSNASKASQGAKVWECVNVEM